MIDGLPPPKPGLWTPEKPAIIRPAEKRLLRPMSLMPVFSPVVSAAAPFNLEFRTFAVGTSDVTIPASAQAGDLGVLACWGVDDGDFALTSGWTAVANTQSTSSAQALIAFKVLDAGDPNTAITALDGNTSAPNHLVAVFSGGAASASAFDGDGQGTSQNPSSQSVTASGGTPPLVVIGVASVFSGPGTFSTASPAFDDTVDSTGVGPEAITLGYKIYNSSPQDHSIDKNDEGGRNYLGSCYIQASK